jgi:hypothetical protein
MNMNTTFVFCIISLTLSIDYSLGLISLQAYWIDTGGNKSLSGLVFGIYDGFTIVLTPLLAWLVNSKKITYKQAFIGGIVVNILGNIIYSFAYLANTWTMVLIGRGVAGMGACTLPLLMVYIADVIDKSKQISIIGYVKYIAALSRVIGPVLGSLFSVTVTDNKFINLYTLVGWIPVILGLITLIIVYKWQEKNKHDIIVNTHNNIAIVFSIFWPVLLLGFVSTIIYWYFLGNVFIIGTHYYDVIKNEHQLGKLYYAGLGGFVLAFIIFLCFKKNMSSIKGLCLGIIMLISTSYLYLNDKDIVFYFATGLTTLSYGLTIPSINILNNTLAKNMKSILGTKLGVSITLLTVFQSLARFAGPALFSLTDVVTEKNGCSFVKKEDYVTHGCAINNFKFLCWLYVSISALFMVIGLLFLNRKLKLEDDSRREPLNHTV